MFNGKVINVSDSLTNNMIRVWSNISETENDVVSRVETILQEQGKSYEDIAKPFTEEEKATEGPRTYHINEIILSEIADDILYMLRKNLVTDAFIVLDGPGTRNQPQDYYKGGICLRDMDPTSASSDNADIEMTYGSIEIRDQLHVTGNKTYSTFEFSEECSNDNEAFFFKPLNAAKEAKKVSDTKNYAYWSPSYKMNQYGETIVSYSIPLISSKGDVFGVLGIGLSVAYLSGQVNIGNTSGEYGAAVCLVKNNEDGSVDLERIVHSGSLGQSVFGSVSSVSALPDGYTNFYKIPSSKVVWQRQDVGYLQSERPVQRRRMGGGRHGRRGRSDDLLQYHSHRDVRPRRWRRWRSRSWRSRSSCAVSASPLRNLRRIRRITARRMSSLCARRISRK